MNHERLADLDLKPVVVFVNTRSGGQQGLKVLTAAWSEKMYACMLAVEVEHLMTLATEGLPILFLRLILFLGF